MDSNYVVTKKKTLQQFYFMVATYTLQYLSYDLRNPNSYDGQDCRKILNYLIFVASCRVLHDLHRRVLGKCLNITNLLWVCCQMRISRTREREAAVVTTRRNGNQTASRDESSRCGKLPRNARGWPLFNT